MYFLGYCKEENNGRGCLQTALSLVSAAVTLSMIHFALRKLMNECGPEAEYFQSTSSTNQYEPRL